MTFQDMRAYSTGLLKASFQNKTTLNKLSTSEDGNLLFDGKEIKSDKGGAGVLIYSTDEHIVGSWINGKPIYQKVIPYITTLNNYIWVETPELINNKEQIIQSFVIGNVTCMPIMGDVDKDGSNYVRIYSMRNTVFDITHVIIQYTKTIDEENSFTPDMIIDHENITDAEIADAAAADKI